MKCVPPGPIYHFGHHKCLTVYFERVLASLAKYCGIPFWQTPGPVPDDETGPFILLSHDSQHPFPRNPNARTTHVIRDPRDVIVSGYFYHLRTSEAWCARPNPDHDDLPANVSYQQHLESLSLEDGLCYEMMHVSGRVIEDMRDWNPQRRNCLECRFEDLVSNEEQQFRRIFEWYGLPEPCIRHGLALARRHSRRRLRRRWPLMRSNHVRRGSHIGQWQQYFSAPVKDAFKQRYQDALESLGYESDADW